MSGWLRRCAPRSPTWSACWRRRAVGPSTSFASPGTSPAAGNISTQLPEIGEAYRAVMGRHYPAMSVVEVSALMEAEAKVEIEATAVLPDA